MIPTFLPERLATSATDATGVPSGATPIMQLSVFTPQAIAVAAAAESVMIALEDCVRVFT